MADSTRLITVQGRGVASAPPDLVILSFDVGWLAESYAEAVDGLKEAVECLRRDIEVAGIHRERLKTQRFAVDHETRWDWEVVHISARSLARVIVGPPPVDEQTSIATVLSDTDAEIAALERRHDKTRAIEQGMMQQLLTGRVRLVKPGLAEAAA